ncbi:hypothetical protein F751_0608 [Auxenochlorella protothecoides]|uniref:Dolichol phosphate-mannose biosynthesis regulatory protein n=1 Tax=Auxenochlorella protothecoides TaxID=3075 RepID=A0A087SIM7_AUXPR|nr:hypothetical protein F751_0608 [Auxenochlorella protothecoides]KFM25581.1 hypothetical protein F751_0608 [Auxenochlorella protothecoides]
MKSMGQRLLSWSLLLLLLAGYAYYTVWILLTPFVDKDQPVFAYFPSAHYATALPLYAILVLLACSLLAVGYIICSEQLKRCARGVEMW